MLQPSAASQGCGDITFGLNCESVAQLRQITFDQRQRPTQLQHQPGVHHVLAGRAQMHIKLGFGITGRDLLAQRLDQWNGGIARSGNRLAEGGEVVMPGLTRSFNRGDSRLRNQPDTRLGPGQRGFEIEHGL